MKNSTAIKFCLIFLLFGLGFGAAPIAPKKALADSATKAADVDTLERTAKSIRATIEAKAHSLSLLRKNLLNTHPGLQGMIRMRLGIAPSGEVTEAKITSSTTGVAGFDEAVRDTIYTWRFKPVHKQGTVTVNVPFNFPSPDSLKNGSATDAESPESKDTSESPPK